MRTPDVIVDGDPETGNLQVVDRDGYVHLIKNRVCWCGHKHPDERAIDVRSDDEVAAGELAPDPGPRP